MSILQFMEMSVVECLICSIAAILFSLCLSGIGYWFAPNRGYIFQSVIGMTLTGAIGVVCAGLCVGVLKYIVISAFLIGFSVTVYRIVKKKSVLKELLMSLIPVCLLFVVIFIQLMRFVVPEDGIFHYNCHLTYFSGVPMEMLQADYFSRIRLMDVYPFEWSKYHFFNGAYISIPLMCFLKKNFISYLLAKMITVCFYAGALFDVAKGKYENKKAWLIWLLGIGAFFVCANNGFIWAIETNNFSSIFMLLLTWLMFEEKDYSCAAMVSIGYAITKSGAVVSGAFLFVFALWKMYRTENTGIVRFVRVKYREALYALGIGIGVLSMVFLGLEASWPSSVIWGSVRAAVCNVYNVGWLCLMPLGGAMIDSVVYTLKFEFLFVAVLVYLLIKNYKNLRTNLKKYKWVVIATVVLSVLFLIGSYYYIRDIQMIMRIFLIFYVVPLVVLFAGLCREMFGVFLAYVISLAMNFLLFDASVTLPNYNIIVFIILMYFARTLVKSLTEKHLRYRYVLYGIIGAGLFYAAMFRYQTIFFMEPQDGFHEELALAEIEYSDEPFEYNGEGDALNAKLNALKGNRVHYNVMPDATDPIMSHISMAMRFLPQGYQNEFE